MLFTLGLTTAQFSASFNRSRTFFFAFWISRRQCRHFALAPLLHHCFEPGPSSFHYSSSQQFIFSVSRVICTPCFLLFCTAKRTASLRSFTQIPGFAPGSNGIPSYASRCFFLISHTLKIVSSVFAPSLIDFASFHHAYNPNVYVVWE